MPATPKVVRNVVVGASQPPVTVLIAPSAWVSTACAVLIGPSSVSRVTARACTWVTSPASQRAMSRSWIIWSSRMPPESAGSWNQARCGRDASRLNRSTAGVPRSPAATLRCRAR